MIRRSAKVVLLHCEAFSMVDDWIDQIELRRDRHATFSVLAKKYGEDPMTGRRRWLDWDKTKGLKNPMAIHKAIEDTAEYLNVQVEWVDAIPLIAQIDWVTAAVIASNVGRQIPELPGVEILLAQRSLRALGPVRVGAKWGCDIHELTLPFDRWVRTLVGQHFDAEQIYWYEGKRFIANWAFEGSGGVVVSYGDGGVGWEGALGELEFIEGIQIDAVDLARVALGAAKNGNSQRGT